MLTPNLRKKPTTGASARKAALFVANLLPGPITRMDLVRLMGLHAHHELDHLFVAFRNAGLVYISSWGQPNGQPCPYWAWQSIPFTNPDVRRPPKQRIPS